MQRNVVFLVMDLLGVTAIVYGLGLLHTSLAFIGGGVVLIAVATLLQIGGNRR